MAAPPRVDRADRKRVLMFQCSAVFLLMFSGYLPAYPDDPQRPPDKRDAKAAAQKMNPETPEEKDGKAPAQKNNLKTPEKKDGKAPAQKKDGNPPANKKDLRILPQGAQASKPGKPSLA